MAVNLPTPRPLPPEVMTWRARSYLIVAAIRNGVIGGAIVGQPETFDTPSFDSLRSLAPLLVWGLAMLFGAGHLTYAAITGKENQARIALIVSASVTGFWAAGFAIVYSRGLATVVAFVLLGALAAKDLIVLAQPLRSPFEPLVRYYTKQ